MTNCTHESCGEEDKMWLPTSNDNYSDVELHSWCINCGLVKNLSDDKGRKLGYWNNVLSSFSSCYSLKQVQKRNIAKELSGHVGFYDIYGITGSAQRDLFIQIVKKNSNIDENNIDSFIY